MLTIDTRGSKKIVIEDKDEEPEQEILDPLEKAIQTK